jgi:thymidine kinase
MCGKLELIIGPMFSGKSTELIRRINLLKTINKKILVIKPQIDTRYKTDKITTHNYESADCLVLENLNSLTNEINNYDVIIIDEGQFFSDLKQTIVQWVDNFKVHIIIGGLDGDFQRKPIGDILELIPYSDKCIKLNSYCNMCKDETEGPFSLRLIKSNDKVLIGGSESYIPVCRKHYLESN